MKAYTKYVENIEGYKDVLMSVKAAQKVAASTLLKINKKASLLVDQSEALEFVKSSFTKAAGVNGITNAGNKGERKILIIIGGNRGLCGDLYARLARAVSTQKGYSQIVLVGKAARKYLEELSIFPTLEYDNPQNIDFDELVFNQIFDYVYQEFFMKKSMVEICYAEPLTLTKNIAKIVNLPLVLTNGKDGVDKSLSNNTSLAVFASTTGEISRMITKKIVSLNLYAAIVKGLVSEFSSRMVSMESAERKTEKIAEGLKAKYFKQRRLYTTQKQLESFVVHKQI
jgi:ATP synthase F1 gamma subunit